MPARVAAVRPRLTHEQGEEIIRELMSQIGDADTAALLVIRVQATHDNEDPAVEMLTVQLAAGGIEHRAMREDH